LSNFQRLLNMASKALDKSGQSSNGQPSNGSNGSGKTDWRDMVRTVADKVTGDSNQQQGGAPRQYPQQSSAAPRSAAPQGAPRQSAPVGTPEDRAAIARYDYLLKTADPHQLEQVHREAFERLTPAQREQMDAQLRADLPAGEQPTSSNPADLARAATRGEAHNPGFLKKMFAKASGRGNGGGAGRGLAAAGVGAVAGAGIGAAGGLLAAVAGGAVLSSVAGPLLEQAAGLGVDFESLAGGFEGFEGLEGAATEAGDFASGLGEQASEFGSNFEIPGLGNLGDFFGRN